MLPILRAKTCRPAFMSDWGSPLDDFQRIFDDSFSGAAVRGNLPMDVVEEGEKYLVSADVPGVSKESLDLSIEEGVLTVKVSREVSKTGENSRILHRGRWQGSVSRTVSFPHSVDEEGIDAVLKDGILTVTVMKKAESSTHKIEIH